MNTDKDPSPFGEIVYAYTRSQAVADGFQVEVTKTAQEAGIQIPHVPDRAVFDNYVTVPEGVSGQDEAGRLWDLIWMTRMPSCRLATVATAFRLRFMSVTTTERPSSSSSSPHAPADMDAPQRPSR